MRAALDHFRQVEPLCHFDASRGNEGFTAHISFNICAYGGARDYLEIALRKAILRFRPKHPEKWSWAEAIREWVAHAVDLISIKESSSESKFRGAHLTGRQEVSIQGTGRLPLFGGLTGTTRSGVEAEHQTNASHGRSQETTRTQNTRHAEMHRPGGDYEIRLSSPADDDLVRLNSEFDRIGVLQSAEPSSTDVESVQVTLTMRSQGALVHAIRIREAVGVWRPLAEPRAKKVLTELLFEKVLAPLHEPQSLWPRRSQE